MQICHLLHERHVACKAPVPADPWIPLHAYTTAADHLLPETLDQL